MATLAKSLFTKYEFASPEEYLAAVTFNDLNLLYLQNKIAEAAEEKVRLTYDPSNPTVFMQREAELQGEIGILTTLLNEHEETIRDLIVD